MTRFVMSRRVLLARAGQVCALPMVTWVAGCSESPQATACVDPNQLTPAELGLRTSLQYTERSPDAQKACNGCAYFKATQSAPGCGQCEILNGAVAEAGHCTSWSARA